MRISKGTQEKLQNLLKDQGFTIRFEKGNFKGGHCVLLEQKVIIINKFHPLESKINSLSEIIRQVEINPELLNDSQKKIWKQLKSSVV